MGLVRYGIRTDKHEVDPVHDRSVVGLPVSGRPTTIGNVELEICCWYPMRILGVKRLKWMEMVPCSKLGCIGTPTTGEIRPRAVSYSFLVFDDRLVHHHVIN